MRSIPCPFVLGVILVALLGGEVSPARAQDTVPADDAIATLMQESYPDLVPPEMILPEETTLRITIDLSDRRLTLYQGDTALASYPVAVGRSEWRTPTGDFAVMQMIRDPTWVNPFTNQVIAGGHPGNPLGRFWIGFWTDGDNWVGMHGTPNPESVGTAASHGCIRLYNTDIQALFSQVSMGTPVSVVP